MLVALDGLDGCGKSTAARALASELSSRGIDAELREHPGDGPFGRMCKTSLLARGRPAALVSAVLLFADMLGTARAVRRREVVIAVRYDLSCYFLHERPARTVHRLFSSFMPMPDADILIDVEPGTAIARIGRRGTEEEMFENPRSMERARRGMLSVPWITVVDGNGTPEEVFAEVLRIVDGLLGKRRRLALSSRARTCKTRIRMGKRPFSEGLTKSLLRRGL